MAKKKADPQAESNPQKAQDKADDDETIEEDTAPVKLAKLKALNALLLKETVERRKQVDSLTKSNGLLKSDLNRSEMDNGLLQSEMNVLTEKAVMLEIEKGLVPLFVVGQMNQLAEERIGSLEGEMKRALDEKSEIEKSNSKKESEISDLNRRLDELIAEVDEERRVSSRVCDERDEIRAQLDARNQEVNELQLKVTEAEKTEAQISEEVVELKANLDRLVEENTVNMQRIDSIMSEKNLIEEALVESNGHIDDLKKNVDDLLEQKKAMEDEKNAHERKNEELQSMVREFKDLIESMKIDEKGLLDQITDLEKKYSTSSENEAILKTQIDGLIEEKKVTDERIESLEAVKSSVLKELEDAMKELEHQKLTVEQMVQEKTELEDAKIQGESEIVKMKEQFMIFQDTINDLEKKYSTSSENEVVMQTQIDGLTEQKKATDERIDRLEIEKSSVIKELQDAMKDLENQKLKIEQIGQEKTELEDAKIEGESEIVKMKEQFMIFQDTINDLEKKYSTSSENEVIKQNQIDGLIEEKKERDERIERLETEKSSVLQELQDAMKELEDQKLTIKKIVQEKTELEDAKDQGESEIAKMKEQLITFQDTSSGNEVILQNQIHGLIKEKKETDARIESLESEKSSVLKDLQDAMKDLEKQKLAIEQIVQEKNELESVKTQGESEIAKMKEQLIAFQDTISSLENSSIDQNQKVKQLEAAVNHYQLTIEQIVQEKTELEEVKNQGESEIAKMKEQLIAFQDRVSSFENSSIDQNQKVEQLQEEVSHFKASSDQATIERDEALKSLKEQEATKTDLQHKITGMEKEIKDLLESLAKMTTENGNYVAEKNNLEDRCEELTKNVAGLEAKLAETLVDFDETKIKLGLAEANSNRVLNTLKKTLSVNTENRDFDLGNGIEEEMKDDVKEVEEIKKAFKEKEIRVEEMKRQLELVKNTAGKEKSFWTMVSSATTLLAAAVSVAYVARAT